MDEKILKKYIPMTETTYYVLISLKEERHGYGIMQFVSHLTDERIKLGTGTLYTMLGRLVEDKIISIVSNDNGKKFYKITEVGEYIIRLEIKRLKNQLKNGVEIYGE